MNVPVDREHNVLSLHVRHECITRDAARRTGQARVIGKFGAVPADHPRFLIVKVRKTDDVRNQGSQRIEPAGFRVHVHARKVKDPHRIDLLIRRALHQRFIRIVGLSEHRGEFDGSFTDDPRKFLRRFGGIRQLLGHREDKWIVAIDRSRYFGAVLVSYENTPARRLQRPARAVLRLRAGGVIGALLKLQVEDIEEQGGVSDPEPREDYRDAESHFGSDSKYCGWRSGTRLRCRASVSRRDESSWPNN